MTKNKLDVVLGILLIIMPFLGFPPNWKTVFYILVGLFLIFYAIRHKAKRVAVETKETPAVY